MKVVAHPLVVAVALGLLAPTALASEDRKERTTECCEEKVDPIEASHFDVVGELSDSELPEVVYLTLD